MLELDDIKKLHDKAYLAGQVTRERAANDLVFYWLTHWDDSILDETQLTYRGEFDILRKAGRGILSDLESNPIQVDFEPEDESRDDAADLLDGMYRASDRINTSIEAYEVANQESVICGFGAYELYTEYQDSKGRNNLQAIRRKPIHEANNVVFWDPNSKLLDRSDAKYVTVLECYSEDGYLDLVEELTGERPDKVVQADFKHPEISYSFPWILGGSNRVYVARFYHRKKVSTKIITLSDPFGQELTATEKDLEEIEDDLIAAGYEVITEGKEDRWEVTRYICSGERILEETVIACEHIPVVPQYGERAIIEGEEHYEGVTRLAKDPQRLRDFMLSYLADIASRSPREKPIFAKEQIAGYEDMYELAGSENNYPYLLQNMKDTQGRDLPIGPIGMLPAPNIPQALASLVPLTKEAVEDVANPGVPEDISDVDLSGKAIQSLLPRFDQQSFIYQTHRKHAKRRDGEIFASMASQIYDVPRTVTLELPDGTRKTAKILDTVVDNQTGEIVVLNDIRNTEFQVYSTISAAYSSKKQETLDRIETMIEKIVPGDPMREILLLKQMILMDGVDFSDVRDYANNKLLLMGIRKPETPEEEQLVMQAQQQGDQPSAEMVLAQAEMLKGQADQMREQRELLKLQEDVRIQQAKLQIDTFKAQTDRYDVEVDAQETGAKIDKTQAEAFGKKLENQAKVIQLRNPAMLTTEEIFEELLRG